MEAHATNTGIDSRKFVMWVVICSECMLFGSLIMNYVIATSTIIPSDQVDLIKPVDVINVPLTSLSTFVLLMSSLAMVLSLSALQEGNLPLFRKWCFSTAFLGVVFIGFQAFEFTEFYWEGLGFTTNVFGSSFFALTGTHGAHVVVGVMLLMTVGIWSYSHELDPTVLEVIGLYWHFVDVIWIVIFTLVYLFVLAP